MKIYFVLFFIFLTGLAVTHAKPKNFCGNLNFTTIENSDLENIIFMEDVSVKRKIKRSQCDLPGEKLNICSECSVTTSKEMMSALWQLVNTKEHLEWHARWHNLRGGLSISEPIWQQAVKENWIPIGTTKLNFLADHGRFAKKTGEDFFYMHRTMIKMVQTEMAANNLPCMSAWSEIPTLLDSHWPRPRKHTDETLNSAQQDWDALQKTFSEIKDPSYLSKISLNQLGIKIENGLHQDLHRFYRSNPKCSAEGRAENICDDLIPVETSPLNRHFWKIHGFVDNIVGLWLTANNYDEIAVSCKDHSRCYQWKGTWTGNHPKPSRP